MYFFWGKMTYEVEWRDDYLGRAGREIRGKRNEVKAEKSEIYYLGGETIAVLRISGKE